ncbi:MAG: cysteine dioxygenase [Nevskia sp.]|nr:cysteine dioxygenase [Nevskia sp.]
MHSAASHFREFLATVSSIVDAGAGEAATLHRATDALKRLIALDDWLPAAFAQADPDKYRQYLLYCDARERFSVVSFVWGPGQSTPIHNHTIWGLVGILRGAEASRRYRWDGGGSLVVDGPVAILEAGSIEAVSPAIGDIHQVSNPHRDRVSISIHLYGGNIGTVRREAFQPPRGRSTFVSGYSNRVLPNFWDERGA